MQIGMIGLGRMGGNIVRRLTRNGHQCVVFDQNPAAIKALVGEHIAGSADLKQLVGQLEKPRAVWLMLPAGRITEETVEHLGSLLEADDIIIDGGNSFYKDDIRRAKALAEFDQRTVFKKVEATYRRLLAKNKMDGIGDRGTSQLGR